MDRRWIALSLTPILFFAASGGARAAEGDPCPANQPRPTISVTDPAGAGSLYATHILRVRFGASGEDDTELRSFAAPGARILPDDNNPEVVSDTPGQLTLTAEFFIQHNGTSFDDRSYTCTMTVTQTVGLQAPNRAVVGRLTRPRLVDRRRNLWFRNVTYSFTVTSAKAAADRSPFTVRARATSRAKYPGARVRALSRVFGQREFDTVEQRYRNGCFEMLICAPETARGFAKGIGVLVDQRVGALKVFVFVPTSYPSRVLGRRAIPTPWGVDVEVLQSGRRIARLRAAGRCTQGGQAARCTFKKASTKP